MSGLYLTLVRRIEEVQEKASLGTAVMKSARKAKGWSYETAAREIHISAKTYERWEKAGTVPMRDLTNVARALELDIEPAVRQTVSVGSSRPAEANPAEGEDSDRLSRLEAKLEEILDLLRQGQVGQAANQRLQESADELRRRAEEA